MHCILPPFKVFVVRFQIVKVACNAVILLVTKKKKSLRKWHKIKTFQFSGPKREKLRSIKYEFFVSPSQNSAWGTESNPR